MLVGNHSAGKSSFINWYIEESCQKTGVAIETSGFTIVHSGKKKDSWQGEASIEYFEWLDGVDKVADIGRQQHPHRDLRVQGAGSSAPINLIDTPGLTDGQMEYPYPVDKVIMYFAEHCDLVCVFFDPIGQALCERTMAVVEELNEQLPGQGVVTTARRRTRSPTRRTGRRSSSRSRRTVRRSTLARPIDVLPLLLLLLHLPHAAAAAASCCPSCCCSGGS